ncbi:MAG: type II toxin-antitoxin system ParD family antitoxin [Caulobacter sp.]|nr:type II toxin-antitoxin system ParD family antitoxin [Caulobacter sp.]
MSNVEKISIALTADMAGGVREAVESGDYATTSEVIRDALRDWFQKRKVALLEQDALRLLIREGMDSGPGRPAEEVFARLTAKYAAMVDPTK